MPRRLSRSAPAAALLVFTSACSIFTDLSELTRGNTSGGGTGGATATSSTGGAAPTTGPGGATTTSGASSSAGSSGAACSGMGELADPATGHCYFYDLGGSDDRFSDARSKCSAWAPGGDLVVIETPEEAAFVFDKVMVQKDTWIGLTDLAVSGTYQWVNGAPLTYTDWDSTFPDDGMGQSQCIAFASSLKWQNAPCSSTKITLCERP